MGYPLEVEVTLKKINIAEIERDEGETTSLHDVSGEKKASAFAPNFDPLLNLPLIFRIEGDCKVKEMTGFLALLDEDFDDHQMRRFMLSNLPL